MATVQPQNFWFGDAFDERVKAFILCNQFADASWSCQFESRRWAKALLEFDDELDIEIKEGMFLIDFDTTTAEGHTWISVNGIIFDPTVGQFDCEPDLSFYDVHILLDRSDVILHLKEYGMDVRLRPNHSEQHEAKGIAPDITLVSNIEELLKAGMPREYQEVAAKGVEAFWARYSALFPEVTSGDSQLTNEPSNAVALWLCESMGVALNDSLAIQDSGLEHGIDKGRFSHALEECIAATVGEIRKTFPSFGEPSDDVRQQLKFVLSDALHWNFPQKLAAEGDLVNAAEEVSAQKQSISVPREALAYLIDMARSHVQDIQSGLEDGTYDKAENTDIDQKSLTVDVCEAIYRNATMLPSASPSAELQ